MIFEYFYDANPFMYLFLFFSNIDDRYLNFEQVYEQT